MDRENDNFNLNDINALNISNNKDGKGQKWSFVVLVLIISEELVNSYSRNN